jgi:hypothetical protein
MNATTRRSFVRKSLATTVSITFTGLIRAHGEGGGGGETTTADPWGTTATTIDTTADTTADTTVNTTVVTSAPAHPLTRTYQLNVWVKSISPKGDGTYSATFTKVRADAKIFNGTQPAFEAPKVEGAPTAEGAPGTLKFGGIAMLPGAGTDQQDEGIVAMDTQTSPNPYINPQIDEVDLQPGELRVLYTAIVYYRWSPPTP